MNKHTSCASMDAMYSFGSIRATWSNIVRPGNLFYTQLNHCRKDKFDFYELKPFDSAWRNKNYRCFQQQSCLRYQKDAQTHVNHSIEANEHQAVV